MTSIDDVYRSRADAANEESQRVERRKREIWLELTPALLAERFRQYSAAPPEKYLWVETPDRGTVAAWQICHNYQGEWYLILLSDGRLSMANVLLATAKPIHGYITLESLDNEWLGKAFESLRGHSDDANKLRCLTPTSWKWDTSEAERRALGYDV